MTQRSVFVLSLLLAATWPSQAQAFISKQKSTIAVTASGVAEVATLGFSIVTQQTGTPTALGFPGSGNDFRDSGAAIKIDVSTNVPGNRLIIYTANLGAGATPAACFDTGNNDPNLGPVGNDGGGLVGIPTVGDPNFCKNTVPMLWGLGVTNIQPTADPKVFTGDSTNVDYVFNQVPLPALGATNGVFMTDRAHVLSFTTKNSILDNQNLVFCSDSSAIPDARSRADNDGLYPQFFGDDTKNSDLCDAADLVHPVSQELSKNIAVVGFNFSGTKGSVPRLDTVASDDIVQLSSPLYVPMGADFRVAPPGSYNTTTLTIELVTQ